MPEAEAAVISTEPLLESEAVWTKLVKKIYKDPKGATRTWESAERRTRPKDSEIDGVGIVAILEKDTGVFFKLGPTRSADFQRQLQKRAGPEIVLQKQYRPPLDKVVIEIPAGLIDDGETPEACALRELKEETGYVAEVLETSPVMWNDPGFCNTNLRMVHVSVDMSLPENQDLKPELEENEFIEVFHVKLVDLWDECIKLEQQGYAIDARVGNLAEGIEMAKKFKL